MSDHAETERLLDAALETYADSSFGSGLEQRVINRIFEEKRRFNRRRWISWIVGPVAACALSLVFIVSRLSHNPSAVTPHTHAPARSATASIAGDRSQATSQPRAKAREFTASNMHPTKTAAAAERSARPKLDVFPTPLPLSDEEKALCVVAATGSQPARRALAEAEIHQDDRLVIARLAISPLETPDEGNK